jgi:hypothetical protein
MKGATSGGEKFPAHGLLSNLHYLWNIISPTQQAAGQQIKTTNYENSKTPHPQRRTRMRHRQFHRLRLLQQVLRQETLVYHEVLRRRRQDLRRMREVQPQEVIPSLLPPAQGQPWAVFFLGRCWRAVENYNLPRIFPRHWV